MGKGKFLFFSNQREGRRKRWIWEDLYVVVYVNNLVRRFGCWWWICEVSFSERPTPERLLSAPELSFLLTPPLSLVEIRGSFTLTHLRRFLLPHCKKNSGSVALHALWFLSSVSIPATTATKQHKNPISVHPHEWDSDKDWRKFENIA